MRAGRGGGGFAYPNRGDGPPWVWGSPGREGRGEPAPGRGLVRARHSALPVHSVNPLPAASMRLVRTNPPFCASRLRRPAPARPVCARPAPPAPHARPTSAFYAVKKTEKNDPFRKSAKMMEQNLSEKIMHSVVLETRQVVSGGAAGSSGPNTCIPWARPKPPWTRLFPVRVHALARVRLCVRACQCVSVWCGAVSAAPHPPPPPRGPRTLSQRGGLLQRTGGGGGGASRCSSFCRSTLPVDHKGGYQTPAPKRHTGDPHGTLGMLTVRMGGTEISWQRGMAGGGGEQAEVGGGTD